MPRLHVFIAGLVVIACSQGAPAQDSKASQGPDIIVKGEKEAKDIAKFTRNPRVPGGYQIESHNELSESEIFLTCARPSAALLRQVIEGPPNAADTITRQGEFVEQHLNCHQHYNASAFTGSSGFGPSLMPKEFATDKDAQSLGRSYQGFFDRAAMLDYAIKTYAPDIGLTKAETHDDAVIERFNNTERARNRYRWPEDLRYFKVAICMVQAEPDLATQMIHTPTGSNQSAKLGFNMLSRARECVPGANRIQVDPVQFRVYVTDALYRWVEAARDVESLIPAS